MAYPQSAFPGSPLPTRISGLAAARPAASAAQGCRFLATDTGAVSISTGSTWITTTQCIQLEAAGWLSGDLVDRPTAALCLGFLYADESGNIYEAFPGGWATVTVLGVTTWGAIIGTLANQADLLAALNARQTVAVAVVTPGATPSFAPGAASSLLTLVPAENETIAGVVTNCVAGRRYTLKVTTSGTSSYTLTFGANFKTTGTLATGATSAKVFTMEFVFDGTSFVEVARTTAM